MVGINITDSKFFRQSLSLIENGLASLLGLVRCKLIILFVTPRYENITDLFKNIFVILVELSYYLLSIFYKQTKSPSFY